MKRRSPTNSNKKNKPKNNDKEVSHAINLFRKNFKEHLSNLIQGGMPFRKASNLLIHRLLSPESKLNVRENIDEIQSICSYLGGNTEEAIHTFLIKREITQLKLIGFNTLDAVNELINRINCNDHKNILSKQKLKKRHREEESIESENKSSEVKKVKAQFKEKDDSMGVEYNPMDYNIQESTKSFFNPFKSNFSNNISRKEYFINNRLKFDDDLETNSGEEEEEMIQEENVQLFRNDHFLLNQLRRHGEDLGHIMNPYRNDNIGDRKSVV